jgi:outer membrane beta-barrel protein
MNPIRTLAAAAAPLLLAAAAQAQQQAPAPAPTEQVVVPQVERRDVKLPRIPSKDFSIGVFAGTYSTQNFGTSAVGGVKLGYHITEDVFVEGTYAQTKVSDESFREIFPEGIIPPGADKLTYFNFSAGYNVLPGEVFFGAKRAWASGLYLIGGVGSTKFNEQRKQTINVGFGLRVLVAERAALQLDVRDHMFPLDLLGKRQSTQNLEVSAGLTYFF